MFPLSALPVKVAEVGRSGGREGGVEGGREGREENGEKTFRILAP